MSDINFGQIEEALNNKADLDFRNIDATKADIIIEYQEPSELNNYTWYRLYASGWVEQGGIVPRDTGTQGVITLSIVMLDTNYTVTSNTGNNGANNFFNIDTQAGNITTSTMNWYKSSASLAGSWQVSGKANMAGHEILPSLYPKHEEETWEHRVISFQKPTAENNYTWFRLYADGWVEQGGIWTGTLSAGNGSDDKSTQNIPVAMADTNYCVNITNNNGILTAIVWEMWCVEQLTTTSFVIHMGAYANTRTITRMNWEVKGMAATN